MSRKSVGIVFGVALGCLLLTAQTLAAGRLTQDPRPTAARIMEIDATLELMATETPASADDYYISGIDPDTVSRGGLVTVNGALPSDPQDVVVWLHRVGPNHDPNGAIDSDNTRSPTFWKIEQVRVDNTGTAPAYTFYIPANLPLGSYDLRLIAVKGATTHELRAPVVNDYLAVTQVGDPSVSAVDPNVIYTADGKFKFWVYGSGFSRYTHDNVLWLDNQRMVNCTPDGSTKDCVTQTVLDNGTQLQFEVPAKFAGARNIQIQVGGTAPTRPTEVLLTKNGEWLPFWVSIVVGVVVLAVLFARPRWWWYDDKTRSYSLSRFQFVLWTCTALISIVYLFTAKVFVQGTLELFEIPATFPFLIALPGAALVGGQVISNTVGPKGSNNANTAQISDLYEQGGKASPDRFQLFLFTVLGTIAYIALVLATDPGSMIELPDIPATFLALFGASAAVYLGVKGAAGPGPTITNVHASVNAGKSTIEITGNFLSKTPEIYVGKSLKELETNPKLVDSSTYEIPPTSITNEPKHDEFAQTLTIDFKTAPTDPPFDQIKALRVRNKDGQQSTFEWK